MPISTYAELKVALIAWLDLEGEPDLDTVADTLIALGESRVNRELRLQRMIAQITQVYESEATEYTLPDDYLEMDRVMGPERQTIEMRPAAELDRYGKDVCTDPVYAIDGPRLRFEPGVLGFTLRYYARLPPLSAGTHWLFAAEPGLYLYAALMEAAVFGKESDQEAARYVQAYQQIVQGLLMQDDAHIQPRSQPLRAVTGGGRKSRNT